MDNYNISIIFLFLNRRNKLRSIPFVCPTITKRKEKIEAYGAWPRERELYNNLEGYVDPLLVLSATFM
jgi:hypothetical protein